MKKLILATHNLGKVAEIKKLLDGIDIEIFSVEEVGIFEDIIEDGRTFTENALKKAKFIANKTDCWVVADDSGICIDALDGAPGVYSARWADDLVGHTLSKMLNVSDDKRQAHFVSAVVFCSGDTEQVFIGRIDGRIATEPRGKIRPKLPYDTIFIPNDYDITFAEMTDSKKNSLSHRGLAFRQLREFIEKNCEI
jgi:XTP/dITP diphosphohydrolase